MGKVIDSTPDGYGIYNPITRMWYDPSRKVFIRQYPAQLLLYVVAEQILKSFYRSYQGTRLVINPLNNCRIPATKKVALQRPAR